MGVCPVFQQLRCLRFWDSSLTQAVCFPGWKGEPGRQTSVKSLSFDQRTGQGWFPSIFNVCAHMVFISKEDDLLPVLCSLIIFNPHFDLSIESGIIVFLHYTRHRARWSIISNLHADTFEVNNPIRQVGNPGLTGTMTSLGSSYVWKGDSAFWSTWLQSPNPLKPVPAECSEQASQSFIFPIWSIGMTVHTAGMQSHLNEISPSKDPSECLM